MSRMIIAILLFLSSCAVIAQSILAYELNTTQSLVAEEETNDDKPVDKGKEQANDKCITYPSIFQQTIVHFSRQKTVINDLRNCKGYTQLPYMPPEVI